MGTSRPTATGPHHGARAVRTAGALNGARAYFARDAKPRTAVASSHARRRDEDIAPYRQASRGRVRGEGNGGDIDRGHPRTPRVERRGGEGATGSGAAARERCARAGGGEGTGAGARDAKPRTAVASRHGQWRGGAMGTSRPTVKPHEGGGRAGGVHGGGHGRAGRGRLFPVRNRNLPLRLVSFEGFPARQNVRTGGWRRPQGTSFRLGPSKYCLASPGPVHAGQVSLV